jgi:heme/copper-type cytochrome/quinol oxidase subunit 2
MTAQVIFWVAVVACVIAHRYILRSAFAAGAAAAPTDTAHLPTVRKPVELMWVLLPAVALVATLVFTYRAMSIWQAPAPTDAQTSAAQVAT